MQKLSRFAVLSCIVLLHIIVPPSAQPCPLYTYSDMWLDDNGNAVAINYTDGEAGCGDYSAYSTTTITMPNGSSYYASDSAFSTFAEAVAQAAALNVTGEGSLDLGNEVAYACEDPQDTWFQKFWETANTRAKYVGTHQNCRMIGTVLNCDYNVVPWCTDATSPPDLWDISPVTDSAAYVDISASQLSWELYAACIRLGSLTPFECGHAYAKHPPTIWPSSTPKGSCTCRNLRGLAGHSGC